MSHDYLLQFSFSKIYISLSSIAFFSKILPNLNPTSEAHHYISKSDCKEVLVFVGDTELSYLCLKFKYCIYFSGTRGLAGYKVFTNKNRKAITGSNLMTLKF